MVGLFADHGEFQVPLASHGRGTQQLTLFTLARALASESDPIFVVDEIEAGLEPFRQRDLLTRVREAAGSSGQVFLTTHSPAVIGEIPASDLYRLTRSDAKLAVSRLPDQLDLVRRDDPEALLCRLAIIVEGETELGLLEAVLGSAADQKGTTLGAMGIRCVDGGGQPRLFATTTGFRKAEQRFGAFLDTDTKHSGTRADLETDQTVAYATYTLGNCFEAALGADLPIDFLDRLIDLPEHEHEVIARRQQLNEKSGQPGRLTLAEIAAIKGEHEAREIFIAAARSSKSRRSPTHESER